MPSWILPCAIRASAVLVYGSQNSSGTVRREVEGLFGFFAAWFVDCKSRYGIWNKMLAPRRTVDQSGGICIGYIT